MNTNRTARLIFLLFLLLFLLIVIIPAGAKQGTCLDGDGWTKIDNSDLSLYPVDGATQYCFKAGSDSSQGCTGGLFSEWPQPEGTCGLSHWAFYDPGVTPSPSATPTHSPTPTQSVQDTPGDSATPTPTSSPTYTLTPIPTNTPKISNTLVPTHTPGASTQSEEKKSEAKPAEPTKTLEPNVQYSYK